MAEGKATAWLKSEETMAGWPSLAEPSPQVCTQEFLRLGGDGTLPAPARPFSDPVPKSSGHLLAQHQRRHLPLSRGPAYREQPRAGFPGHAEGSGRCPNPVRSGGTPDALPCLAARQPLGFKPSSEAGLRSLLFIVVEPERPKGSVPADVWVTRAVLLRTWQKVQGQKDLARPL